VAAAALWPASAISQEAPGPATVSGQDAPNPDEGAGAEGDVLTRERLFQLEYEVKTAPGTDLNGILVTTTTETWKLRRDTTIPLNTQWSVVLRGDLPYLAKNAYTDTNPQADFLYGIGDVDVQAVAIDDIDQDWKAGGGARLIAPTGDEVLGAGKWQIMPVMAARYALPDFGSGDYVEPLFRYPVSFGGDPSRRSISNLQFAPMLNLSLAAQWSFTLYPNPEIRWNFGAPITGQTGRLFFPFDGMVQKTISEHINTSLEISVPIIKQYPVYNFLTAVRLNVNF